MLQAGFRTHTVGGSKEDIKLVALVCENEAFSHLFLFGTGLVLRLPRYDSGPW